MMRRPETATKWWVFCNARQCTVVSFCLASSLVVFLGARGVGADVANVQATFARGNSLYESGDYDGAIEQYRSLAAENVVDETLYYNLANAYYKSDDLGNAVLFYERAHRLAPRDTDLNENMRLVRAQLKDKQFVAQQNQVMRGIMWLNNNLSTHEMLRFASICYGLLCMLGVAFVFRQTSVISRAYRWVSILSLGRLFGLRIGQDIMVGMALLVFFSTTSSVSAYKKVIRDERRPDAVVLQEEIPVFSGPTADATLQFKIHEGTVVRVRESRREWVRIELPGRLSGWVPAEAIERV